MFRLLIPILLLTATAQAQAPNWSVNPAGFSSTMSVVGTLSVDGLPAMVGQVAAFVGEQVRGVGNPIESGGQYLFILTIHGNTDGETIALKAYLADEDIVVDIAEAFTYEVNGVLGTPVNPLVWTATSGTGPCASAPPDWSVDAFSFSSSMSLTAAILVEEGRDAHENDVLAAFVGDEIRGVVTPQEVSGKQVFFLTVHGNQNGEDLSFRFYDAQARALLQVNEHLSFGANEIEGSALSPLQLSAVCNVEATDSEFEEMIKDAALLPAYPNPFSHQTTISYSLMSAAWVKIEVYDVLGQKVAKLVDGQKGLGQHGARWSPYGLPSGIYFYRLQTGATTLTRQMMYLR